MIKGKVFVVTGANSGIGRACVFRLVNGGAKVGMLDIVSPKELEAEIIATGGDVMALECDVTSSTAVDEAIESVVARFGPLDGCLFSSMRYHQRR